MGLQHRSAPDRVTRVVGAVGDWDQDVLARAVGGAGGGMREQVRRPRAALWADRTPIAYASGGYCWAPLAPGGSPTSWTSAAEERLAAGLFTSDGTALVHTCAWGLQSIYVRIHGGAAYFANRIGPLLDLVDEPLHTDWDAWAAILAFGAPQGGATPFVEIRRLQGGQVIDGSAAPAVREFVPGHVSVEPSAGSARDPARVGLLVAQGVPRGRPLRRAPLDITLSGGWDSRLLAGLATRRYRGPIHAWTTSHDDGRDDDLALAPAVADALGLHHHVVVPGPEAWAEGRAAVLERVEHETWLHTWLWPLAQDLHQRRLPLLDGLGGDVLFKNLFVADPVIDAPTRGAAMDLVLTTLMQGIGRRPEVLASQAAAWLPDAARAAARAGAARVLDAPAGITLAVLELRTVRAIAASPLRLFGPECDVRLPFFQPEAVRAALAIPLPDKSNGAYYRALLSAAISPEVMALTSTNDPRPPRPEAPRRHASAQARELLRRSVSADEAVLDMIAPAIRDHLRDPDKALEVTRRAPVLRLLQTVSVLADWRALHRSRLVDEAPPWT